MEAAAVSASTGALNTLLPKLADLLLLVAGEHHSSRRAVEDGVEHLESELTSMRAALEKVSAAAAPPDQLDGQVRLWARDVRDMSYHIEDAIDTYLLREAAAAGRRRPPPPCCSFVVGLTSSARRRRRAIAAEIERIKKEVEEVSRRRERYRIDDHVVAVVDDAPVDRRLPALYANFASLVGVDASVEEVIKLLSMEGDQGAVMMRRKLKLIAIVGPGGIGKTTLANLVYQKLHGQFECQALVSVSQKPNVKAVLSSILCQVSQLKYENFSSWGEKEIIDKIRDVLKDISIFPEDYIIDRDDLIWRWIAEGFIQPKQGTILYEKGERYFDELINRNLIQPICIDVHGKAQACRVHDTILEFIAGLSIEENFVAILNGQCSTSDLPKRIYRLSLQNSKDDITIPDATERFSHVRSLWQGIDLKMPLSGFRVLRALDLGDCSSQNIDNIGNLVHLRYLRLRGTHYNKLPKEIGNLRFLQTLDIKQTRIKELPSTVVHLTQLMRLMVDTWTKLPNGIGNMECLEQLSEIDTSMYPSLMIELSDLLNLRVLEILISTWEQNKEEQFLDCLGSMKKLQIVHIFAPNISLDFMLNKDWTLHELQKLTVGVRRESEDIFKLNPLSGWAEFSPFSILPRWINSSLTNLSYLSIIVKILQQKDLGVLGDLPALCSLYLSVTGALKERLMIIGHSRGNGQAIAFQCLANFNFTSPAMMIVFRNGAMQRLQMLSFCFQLKETKVFHSDLDMGLENLTSLKTVHFRIDCRYARLWEVQAAEVALRNATNLNLNSPTLDLSKHFERLMYWDGMEEIPEMKIFKEENVGIVKIGPWGGNRGRRYDIEVAPHHLESIRVHSDLAVHSFEFEYSDRNGQKHVAGPWGGYGGSNVHMIQLESSEVLVEVSGTFGRFAGFQNIITSLTFVTNTQSYGPFGQREGTPFHIPVQCGGRIVGFFGRAGWCFDAIGIYVNPDLQTIKDKGKVVLAKIGPCGGKGGEACDIMVPPHHLESVTICSNIVIHSLTFSYNDHNGDHHLAGLWGSHGGSNQTIQFGPSEFITRVYGTIGSYNTPSDVVTSITLVTNAGCYGPFGQENGIPFDFPVQGNGSIVGFFGHANLYVDAIGVYVTPSMGTRKEEENVGLTKIGPFGRRGGNPFDIKVTPHQLESITISSNIVINSLAFSYISHDKQQHIVGPWGSGGESSYTIQLGPSEFFVKVSGTFGPFGEFPNVITSLTFVTNTHHQYGPFGQGGGTPFHAPMSGNGSIVGFFGREGLCIEAVGFYFCAL
ncbi:disease resistance protein PIK6-NP-like [Oryza glaberrima]|uniref:disease resistance protein PIK6-NP-like n=1 Tax=Oryza glaberrima TaxID=4538 RepID=UPI00224C1592|nr:disease resistance protein PIK6-NP-like [Oryza glaberrima]